MRLTCAQKRKHSRLAESRRAIATATNCGKHVAHQEPKLGQVRLIVGIAFDLYRAELEVRRAAQADERVVTRKPLVVVLPVLEPRAVSRHLGAAHEKVRQEGGVDGAVPDCVVEALLIKRVERRKRPVKARMAPTMAFAPGRGALGGRQAGMKERRGTKTTTRPVMKADLMAVVRARPAVWSW